jgi:hypothetical protein
MIFIENKFIFYICLCNAKQIKNIF